MTTSHGSVDSFGSTSAHLLGRVRDRDEVAWRQLAELYSPLVYHWCRQSRVQPADAADIVQEVFRGVLAGIATFDHQREGATFRGWLRSITRHKLADLARRREKQPPAPGGTTNQQWVIQLPATQEDEAESGGDLATELGDRDSRVRDAMLRLRGEVEDRTWLAFWGTTVEDRPSAEVASDLGMSLTAVYQAKSRALARLRALLAD
jgi:RNA polymerase sigma-70 factor, ECF subfamily